MQRHRIGATVLISALALTACGSDPADAGAADTGAADTGSAGTSDTGTKDTGTTDAGTTDAGTPDAGTTDAGTPDAGATDAGIADSGTPDAGTPDAGAPDAGTPDAGAPDAGTADAGTTDAGTTDAGPAPDTSGVVCSGTKPKFPKFAKTCTVDSDCVARLHQTNCCGTQVAHAVAKSHSDAYDAAEKACTSQYPACGCASQPTVAEDGHVAPGGLKDVTALCKSGVCLATVPSKKGACSTTGVKEPQSFRWCQSNKDCTYVLHQVDCCGSKTAWGVTKTSKTLVEAASYTCGKLFPKCKCLEKPVTTDDGDNASSGLIMVQCESGLCMTSIKY